MTTSADPDAKKKVNHEKTEARVKAATGSASLKKRTHLECLCALTKTISLLNDTENNSDLLFIRFAVLFSSRAFIPVFHLPFIIASALSGHFANRISLPELWRFSCKIKKNRKNNNFPVS